VTGAPLGHGFRLLELGAVGSTNDVARELADQGEPEGLFVRAVEQTAGRGRHGRVWQSPPGNLHASLLLRPIRPMAEVATLSLVAALALAEAVAKLSGGAVQPRLKWPNDVQIEGAKVAGILLEAASDARGACSWLIVGMGVNVAACPGDEVPYPTTSLAAAGLAEVTVADLLAALAATLRPRFDQWAAEGFGAVRAAWLARAVGVGTRVEVRLGEKVIDGQLLDVDSTGAICLKHRSGEFKRFAAGEIVLGRPA
jgi:BirA family biotin operon repressor/biotin-[acetyl-CoA-carboxylase] ligase